MAINATEAYGDVPEELLTRVEADCPGCGSSGLTAFYRFEGAPVHSVLLMRTKDEALNYPKGGISLAICGACGHITNTAYDPGLQEYSQRCEESQGYSETFNSFARALAKKLVDRHGLYNKKIIEIGCGKGEFLELLCSLGGNTGVGFDPAYVEGRLNNRRAEYVKDFYGEKYADYSGDLIVCKMTLEHISKTGEFLRALRRAVDGKNSVIFFQVPDATRVFKELAFWDIYYEHCSYFSPASLANLFRISGFEVTDQWTDYEGQYIMLEARPSDKASLSTADNPLKDLNGAVCHFALNHAQKITLWKYRLREFMNTGYRTVIWGSGSKGVAFLTTLGINEEVRFAIDINPHRHGTFMAGTGHRIAAPEELKAYRPDAVIAMNPVYRDEIGGEIKRLGLNSVLLTV